MVSSTISTILVDSLTRPWHPTAYAVLSWSAYFDAFVAKKIQRKLKKDTEALQSF